MENKELLVNTLMVEYKNIHERVFYSIKKFEASNIKVLSVMGVVLVFCFQNLEAKLKEVVLSVDVSFFIVMPILCFTALAMANSHMHEVIYFGNYLKIIENKVNIILKDDIKPFGFEKSRLIDWEYWRRFHGYQREGDVIVNITFGVFSTSLVFVLYVASVVIRLISYHSSNYDAFSIWLSISLAIFVMMIYYILVSANKVIKRRKRQAICYKLETTNYKAMDL